MYLGYYNPASTVTYDLTDGDLNADTIYVGGSNYGTPGTFTQSGGTHTVTDLMIADHADSVGIYNLSGGMLDAGTVTLDDGDASFNFTGGTLSVDTFNGDLTVGSGAILAPGNSPGVTTVNGDAVFDTGSVFQFEVEDLNSFDQLIADNITFESGSIIDVSFLSGYLPGNPETWEDVFTVSGSLTDNGLSFQGPVGFDPADFLLIDGLDGTFDIKYQDTAPPPSAPELPVGAMQMMVLGLGGVLARFRKRG
jgi:hypothetical protein